MRVAGEGRLMGAPVIDRAGAVVGRAERVLVDPGSLAARWLAVTLLDGTSAVVPTQAASVDGTGRLILPYDAALLAGAPKVSGGVVTEQISAQLRRYYGLRS